VLLLARLTGIASGAVAKFVVCCVGPLTGSKGGSAIGGIACMEGDKEGVPCVGGDMCGVTGPPGVSIPLV